MPRQEGSHTQAVRLIRMLRRLQGRRRGLRLEELMDEFAISRSQVRRDLLALEEAGIRLAIDQEPGRYGRARARLLDADSTSIPVTRRERYMLLAARGLLHPFRGSPLAEDMESLFEKVIETMPTDARRDVRALQSKIVYLPTGGTKSYEGAEDILDALLTGVLMERLVRFTYRPKSGRPSSGTMAPYALVIYRNGLYVVAQRVAEAEGAPIRQAPRVFAVERFTEADWIRGTRAAPPPDLTIEDLFDGAFGLITGTKTHHVVVDFAPATRADVLSRRWHRTQTTTELPNGHIRVEFDVTSLREVVPWILEWGPDARAVEPNELRHRVGAALKKTLEQYSA